MAIFCDLGSRAVSMIISIKVSRASRSISETVLHMHQNHLIKIRPTTIREERGCVLNHYITILFVFPVLFSYCSIILIYLRT